jgi:hypothetical protein
MRGAGVVAVISEAPGVVRGRDRCGGRATSRIRTSGAGPAARLTPPGRMAVTGVSALLAGALSVGLAAAAQAAHGRPASHGGAAVPGRYAAKVLVQPGQSLWVLAQTYDPRADPRQAVAQIQQLNSMSGAQVSAGQVLWVPRG